MQDVPDLREGDAQAHRCQLGELVDLVDDDGLDAGLDQLVRQMPQCRREEIGRDLSQRVAHRVQALEVGDRPPDASNGAGRILRLAARHESEAGCLHGGRDIGDAEEHRLVSACLQRRGERRHWQEMARQGQADKTDLHDVAPDPSVLSCRTSMAAGWMMQPREPPAAAGET